ncbi:coiled-coil domain-containing protein 174-like [Tubulanus polymorphus]|uniref:coiled-coil domain-containing protein 174-like n=1 Tax=Tubulanus polymorphus TaxID=672921 RepID=UPI003DA31937
MYTTRMNAGSLIDLKAELQRKQDEAKKLKLSSGEPLSAVRITNAQKKLPALKQNKGVEERAQKDAEELQKEANKIDLSKEKLIAKAKIYDQLSKNIDLAEKAEGFLVDFERKVIDHVIEERDRQKIEEIIKDEKYNCSGPQDEWVDYVDSFGRTRRCMRRDLPEFIKLDQSLNIESTSSHSSPEASTSSEYTPLIGVNKAPIEKWKEDLHKKWETQELENQQKNGPLHYQDVHFDDRRSMGVSYYQFSTDETDRHEQMKELDDLRKQTQVQRERREKLKAKRKAQMDLRLAKVKMRKQRKEGIEPDEKKSDEESDEEDDKDGNEYIPNIAPIPEKVSTDPELNERINRIKNYPVREWDIGKQDMSSFSQSSIPSSFDDNRWKDKLRQERITEFAPPNNYDTTSRNQTRTKAEIPPPNFY